MSAVRDNGRRLRIKVIHGNNRWDLAGPVTLKVKAECNQRPLFPKPKLKPTSLAGGFSKCRDPLIKPAVPYQFNLSSNKCTSSYQLY